nr:lipase member K-like isoform X2 [Leptinotarsa decemlineata]
MLCLIIVILFITTKCSCSATHKNNVCKTLQDYSSINTNKNCWYNPDVHSSPVQIAERHGFFIEEHKVVTKDGYILTLYRIPLRDGNKHLKGIPVLIQHGIGGSAILWMLLGHDSLAFVLSRNGYDVWLPTIRGGVKSDQHTTLSTSDPNYWDYSFHEMAVYDMPAVIEYISKITRHRKKIIYIGHSMGATISFVYSNLLRKHATQHLEEIIALSPVIYTKNMEGIAPLLAPFSRILKDIYPSFFNNFPRGVSLKTLSHFAQCIVSGNIQMYDYGSENIFKYNSTSPPLYESGKMSLPIHFFVGLKDYLGTRKDVENLHNEMKRNGVSTSIHYFDYTHNEFFLGKNLEGFYGTLLKVMNGISKT